ncbi:cyclin-T2-like [Melanotaenia boesemani]|uniref:cyclin-T2-like n=1 Tax=Melanotaenia boesemani TaxID=1250792 RepID=UPI001C059918|nr:cyclin-T2-like [Melanotaenia boesemani]
MTSCRFSISDRCIFVVFVSSCSLHLTTFCLQYRPTVVACVCIHLACKWSNWEIPVSTDGKHWWEYVDDTVTLQLLDELTHEFLQILERTPSKLKRIRNWRAIQAAKKPKTEGSAVDAAFQGTSLDSLPCVANSFFPSTSSSDSTDMPTLNTITAPYDLYQPLSDQSKACGYDQYSQPPTSDFTLVKHKHRAAGGSSEQQQLGVNAAAFSRPQKVLTLEKYREKQAAELALQGVMKEDVYAPPRRLLPPPQEALPAAAGPPVGRRQERKVQLEKASGLRLRRERLRHRRGNQNANQSFIGAAWQLGAGRDAVRQRQTQRAQWSPPLKTRSLVFPQLKQHLLICPSSQQPLRR